MTKSNAFKSLALAGMMALSAVPPVTAQTISPSIRPVDFAQNLELQKTKSGRFSCGPHLQTYVVRSLNKRSGKGIRCVKMSAGRPGKPRTPRLAWYGEGNWGGKTYRHVGHAFYRGRRLVGYASDMYGNGEHFKNNFPGNLKVRIINANRIRVTGAWNEDWVRVKTTNYRPLRRPRTCGKYFDKYRVSDLLPQPKGRNGKGLRCVLRVGPAGTYARRRYFTTWFGNGQWEGNRYSHLGTRSTKGRAGASDICGTRFGPVCNKFAYGSLKIKPAVGGYNVIGAWREKWR